MIQQTKALRGFPAAPFLFSGIHPAGKRIRTAANFIRLKGKGVRVGASLLFLAAGRATGKGGDDVKAQGSGQALGRGKIVAVGLLFVTSAAITLLGLAFSALSAWNRWEFLVFQAKVSGVAFGAVVAFLGMRYFLAVQKLKRAVYNSNSRFAWSNFRKG